MTSRLMKRIGSVAAGAALAAVLTVGLATPGRADDRDWRMHERGAQRWHVLHPHPVVMVAPVVYAPPVVVAPPPPPGLSLVFPLNFH